MLFANVLDFSLQMGKALENQRVFLSLSFSPFSRPRHRERGAQVEGHQLLQDLQGLDLRRRNDGGGNFLYCMGRLALLGLSGLCPGLQIHT